MTEILEVNGTDGMTRWYKDSVLHREGGPAIIGKNGYEEWHLNGKLHRADGPAVIFENGTVGWWYGGDRIVFDKIDSSHPLYHHMLVYHILAM
jgi:hypothetical protein